MVKINVSNVKSLNIKTKNTITNKTIKKCKIENEGRKSKALKQLITNDLIKEKEKRNDMANAKPLLKVHSIQTAVKPTKIQINHPLDLKMQTQQKLQQRVSSKYTDGITNALIRKSKRIEAAEALKSTVKKEKPMRDTTMKTKVKKVKIIEKNTKDKEISTVRAKNKKKIEQVKPMKTTVERKPASKTKSIVKPTEKHVDNMEKMKKIKPKIVADATELSNEKNYSNDIVKDEEDELENHIVKLQCRKDLKFKNATVEPLTEERFDAIMNIKKIENVCSTFDTLLQREIKNQKNIVVNDYRYILNVASYKIPNCPKRMVKLKLKHSLVNLNENDVVLIVADLKRGAKFDYEPTIEHYQDILREAGVNKNLKIRPFNQIRKECKTYEGKHKFANSFDYFMCDGRIIGHVNGYCGNVLQKPRTTLHPVRMNNPSNYKREIERSLKRTAFRQLKKGDLIAIPVGHSRLTSTELAENIKYVLEQLKLVYPGGYRNIRNIYLRADIRGTSAIPLFINLSEPPQKVPHVIGMREQRLIKLKIKANEILRKFGITKAASLVKVRKPVFKAKHKL